MYQVSTVWDLFFTTYAISEHTLVLINVNTLFLASYDHVSFMQFADLFEFCSNYLVGFNIWFTTLG